MYVYRIEGRLAKHFGLGDSVYKTPQGAADRVRLAVRSHRLWDIEEWDEHEDGRGLVLTHVGGYVARGPVTRAITWVDTGVAGSYGGTADTWLTELPVKD